MVGRLVQEQQFRVADQRLRQGHAALPAAGERTEPGRGVELQPRQHGFHLRVQTPAVLVLQLGLQGVQARHQRRGVGALRGGELGGGAVIIGDDLTHRAQGTGERVLDGVIGSSTGSCGTSARRSAWARCTVPVSGSKSPASSLRSVDLPLPLRPTRASRSPASTCSAASSSKGTRSKASDTLFQGKDCHRVSLLKYRQAG